MMKKNTLKYRIMGMMVKMMIACDKSSFLISKQIDSKLSLKEKISLKMHLLSCKICRIYKKDINALNDYLKNNSCCSHHLDDNQKVRLNESILQEMNK